MTKIADEEVIDKRWETHVEDRPGIGGSRFSNPSSAK